ncbi:branched-chain amino acid ABC transporter permease [Jannaschia seohaensis]|uniref:Branched-chain amino acid transport system permease protein n=1 Tax=Jannaschia seohaensis TaxID=475081 RepID=A0A2Y9B831_9RHOB|nr:branched-chain amino acid ABC transporter permease [Jannaschia seohaensis]PWJ13826.1 branched-chain amino acid transport system permease protein [Jannaschia seohaensis]SSA50339.1 branched-chain amino acid transport system permease protein [Jannaschia seohaensis]
MDGFTISVLTNIALFSFLAISAWILLIAGEISFGQQAYFAIGAYAAGIATAVWQWPFVAGIAFGTGFGAAVGALVAWPTIRLSGLHFAIATLAFAELVRASLNVFSYQRDIDGYATGPDGANGFRDIRWVYEAGIEPGAYLVIVAGCLAAVIALVALMARGRGMARLRIVGEDPILAAMQGLSVARTKIAAAGLAGGVAGMGGALYAHLATYIEPAQFSVMTGVHALAYGLIGGLGTVLGPILGVLIDIGLLESLRVFSGYRMIVFGGLVALVLILRPRGLLDERNVHRISAWLRR